MGLLMEIMDEMKSQLERQIAAWEYPEAAWIEVARAGDPQPMSAWAIFIEEVSQRFDQNAGQTSADIGFEVEFIVPAEEEERFVFHSSLDEDGIMRAIWNLRMPGDALARIAGDSEVLYTEIDVPNAAEPARVFARRVVCRWEYDFSDAREHPAPPPEE